MTAEIDTISLRIKANDFQHATEIANQCNQNMCDGKASFNAITHIQNETYIITLGSNQHQVTQKHQEIFMHYRRLYN